MAKAKRACLPYANQKTPHTLQKRRFTISACSCIYAYYTRKMVRL